MHRQAGQSAADRELSTVDGDRFSDCFKWQEKLQSLNIFLWLKNLCRFLMTSVLSATAEAFTTAVNSDVNVLMKALGLVKGRKVHLN